MIERCLCVYAVCHICVFEKKCCLSVQNTELQLKNLTLPFVDYVFNTSHKRTSGCLNVF